MDEQTMTTTYQPPELVELGEFTEDTLGLVGDNFDGFNRLAF